ncbi:MAG TPA: PEGA domain-containing protein [Bryobacteraceae bacterium]|nr:PEGA domain-containing protein [Bryobacteraceae bacterium]
MKYSTLFVTIVLLSAALLASVPNQPAVYLHGSAAIPNGTQGSFNVEDAREFHFDYEGGTFRLPYDRITKIELEGKAGVKSHMAQAVSWFPKFGKKQGKLLTIAFKSDKGTGEAAVFEISRVEFQAIAPVLEARTGQHIKSDEDETTQSANANTPLPAPPPPGTPLVLVTVTSEPEGAMVSFWGQPAGKTPVMTRLAPGSYTVEISASGLQTWKREIVVEAGKPQTIAADLRQATEPTVVSVR